MSALADFPAVDREKVTWAIEVHNANLDRLEGAPTTSESINLMRSAAADLKKAKHKLERANMTKIMADTEAERVAAIERDIIDEADRVSSLKPVQLRNRASIWLVAHCASICSDAGYPVNASTGGALYAVLAVVHKAAKTASRTGKEPRIEHQIRYAMNDRLLRSYRPG
ncbi:hypothetical protein [Sphingomicrobium clamense]|uniref:Uncharacterized protein n=1 Tax=Sphingomicrobium clamense TaxID=2851013 RepID=A0ABS6V7J7_9SPHN|nr:hypothetical protein [Sphingomicrobium sp. B8]MBW0145534.1 hypothetical protein [Sphingomicrobium sp. B8]